MKTPRLLLFAVALMAACRGPHGGHGQHVHVVYLLDASASIEPAAFEQAMQAIDAKGVQLHRGDCLTVLPILSDADAIPPGQVVRICVPIDRALYDQDLRDYQEHLHRALGGQSSALSIHRGSRTDILGSLNLVEQEFALDGPQVQRVLIVFSDFIEEDGERSFVSAPNMATPERAESLARRIAEIHAGPVWAEIPVFLGNLTSTELPRLSEQRRESIRRFWLAYFRALHAHPFYAADGPDMSVRFLSSR